jgi:nitrogen-specific signal transduction histidine kinase
MKRELSTTPFPTGAIINALPLPVIVISASARGRSNVAARGPFRGFRLRFCRGFCCAILRRSAALAALVDQVRERGAPVNDIASTCHATQSRRPHRRPPRRSAAGNGMAMSW